MDRRISLLIFLLCAFLQVVFSRGLAAGIYDINRDGLVDREDLKLLTEDISNLAATYRGELTGDGKIDLQDVRELARYLMVREGNSSPTEREIQKFVEEVTGQGYSGICVDRKEFELSDSISENSPFNEASGGFPGDPDGLTIEEIVMKLDGIAIDSLKMDCGHTFLASCGGNRKGYPDFRCEDMNRDGKIDQYDLGQIIDEYRKIVPENKTDRYSDSMMSIIGGVVSSSSKFFSFADSNRDGTVSRDEFYNFILNEKIVKDVIAGRGDRYGFKPEARGVFNFIMGVARKKDALEELGILTGNSHNSVGENERVSTGRIASGSAGRGKPARGGSRQTSRNYNPTSSEDFIKSLDEMISKAGLATSIPPTGGKTPPMPEDPVTPQGTYRPGSPTSSAVGTAGITGGGGLSGPGINPGEIDGSASGPGITGEPGDAGAFVAVTTPGRNRGTSGFNGVSGDPPLTDVETGYDDTDYGPGVSGDSMAEGPSTDLSDGNIVSTTSSEETSTTDDKSGANRGISFLEAMGNLLNSPVRYTGAAIDAISQGIIDPLSRENKVTAEAWRGTMNPIADFAGATFGDSARDKVQSFADLVANKAQAMVDTLDSARRFLYDSYTNYLKTNSLAGLPESESATNNSGHDDTSDRNSFSDYSSGGYSGDSGTSYSHGQDSSSNYYSTNYEGSSGSDYSYDGSGYDYDDYGSSYSSTYDSSYDSGASYSVDEDSW